eukprot:TRINITY_DN37248_c0_g1_i1.p1 TRINITY_DN37248_c0_g1~~TRINITY_DN37248_c0_g1_i1.p1  ORF type:complete len:1171 (+),score=327.28 TRINITY_DN37248_c0_g1_i1:57-3569(+)
MRPRSASPAGRKGKVQVALRKGSKQQDPEAAEKRQQRWQAMTDGKTLCAAGGDRPQSAGGMASGRPRRGRPQSAGGIAPERTQRPRPESAGGQASQRPCSAGKRAAVSRPQSAGRLGPPRPQSAGRTFARSQALVQGKSSAAAWLPQAEERPRQRPMSAPCAGRKAEAGASSPLRQGQELVMVNIQQGCWRKDRAKSGAFAPASRAKRGQLANFSAARGLQEEEKRRQEEVQLLQRNKALAKAKDKSAVSKPWKPGDPLPSLKTLLETVMKEFDLKLEPRTDKASHGKRPASAPLLRVPGKACQGTLHMEARGEGQVEERTKTEEAGIEEEGEEEELEDDEVVEVSQAEDRQQSQASFDEALSRLSSESQTLLQASKESVDKTSSCKDFQQASRVSSKASVKAMSRQLSKTSNAVEPCAPPQALSRSSSKSSAKDQGQALNRRDRIYSEDEEILFWSQAVLRDTFARWDTYHEGEIRIDDLTLILMDLGIEADQDRLATALEGMIYATLDWTDFSNFIFQYRKLERAEFLELFKDADEDGSGAIDAEELVKLLRTLGFPATLQSATELLKTFLSPGEPEEIRFLQFERMINLLQRTEGLSEKELQELRTLFDAERMQVDAVETSAEGTDAGAAGLSTESVSLEKVWRVINFKGFPIKKDEIRQAAKLLFGDEETTVTFQMLLKILRYFKDRERLQTADLIRKYSRSAGNAIQVADLPDALGDLGYYPDEDAIAEYLENIGDRESEDSLNQDELFALLQEYRKAEGFTHAQFEEFKRAFARADRTGQGRLDALQLTQVVRQSTGFKVSLQDTRHAMLQVDLEGSGLLSLCETLKLLHVFTAREAMLRRKSFLALAAGDSPRHTKLDRRCLQDALSAVLGHVPDTGMLQALTAGLGLELEDLNLADFDRLCSLCRASEAATLERQWGHSDATVALLQKQFEEYAEGCGAIAWERLPKLLLEAFPGSTGHLSRQRARARAFIKEVQEKWKGELTFEAFLFLARAAEDDAEIADVEEEAELVEKLRLSRYEVEGFREVFVDKAKHESTLSSDAILEVFGFALEEFDAPQTNTFMRLIGESDSRHGGAALRFPDFLRLMKLLTRQENEKDLGILRAALRRQKEKEAHEKWFSTQQQDLPCMPAALTRGRSKGRANIVASNALAGRLSTSAVGKGS